MGRGGLAPGEGCGCPAKGAPPPPTHTPLSPPPTLTPQMLATLLLDQGDSLVAEEYTYPVLTESLAAPRGVAALPVPVDGDGIVPEALEQVGVGEGGGGWEGWGGEGAVDGCPTRPPTHPPSLLCAPAQLLATLAARPPGALPRFPKLLYTVPVGQNPTGARARGWGGVGARVCVA